MSKLVNIVSWNVNGLCRRLINGDIDTLLFGEDTNGVAHDIDILCLQETKTRRGDEELQINLRTRIKKKFPYRYWQSTHGTTQRKGLSGTTIWSSIKPVREIPPPESDEQGRITALEFPKFILVSVYTPNSGSQKDYRGEEWHISFSKYISELRETKPTYICGDFNVCHLDIDINNVKRNKNKKAGFFDFEREQFQEYLDLGYTDVFRSYYPDELNAFTWWSSFRASNRENNTGWRLDYFLASHHGKDIPASFPQILQCEHLTKVMGSDHCPTKIIVKQAR